MGERCGDHDDTIFRRFKSLSAQNVHRLQNQLWELEKQLEGLDTSPTEKCASGNAGNEREDIMDAVEELLKRYDTAIAIHERLQAKRGLIPSKIRGLRRRNDPEAGTPDTADDMLVLHSAQQENELSLHTLGRHLSWDPSYTASMNLDFPEPPSAPSRPTPALRKTARSLTWDFFLLVLAQIAFFLIVLPLFLFRYIDGPTNRLWVVFGLAPVFALVMWILRPETDLFEIVRTTATYVGLLGGFSTVNFALKFPITPPT